VHHVRFDSLTLRFPSATKRLLGDAKFSYPTTLANKKTADASHNALVNCSFFAHEGHPLVNSAGSGMLFENVRVARRLARRSRHGPDAQPE
jgi:hypothetical protein